MRYAAAKEGLVPRPREEDAKHTIQTKRFVEAGEDVL
jgi:hypothetical protein